MSTYWSCFPSVVPLVLLVFREEVAVELAVEDVLKTEIKKKKYGCDSIPSLRVLLPNLIVYGLTIE